MTFFTIAAGIIAGLSPAVFTIYAYACGNIPVILISFMICIAVSTALMQSPNKKLSHIKRSTAVIAYGIFQLLLFVYPRIYGNAYRMMNPGEYYEYGGPNAGSGFGLIHVAIPLAVIMIIVAYGLSLIISRKRSRHKK